MRSTSGITCCHFFCSAVFSMPVCRKPTVGDTETTVSPSSSSTSRSTPCVLGCCGPMLTVMVSVRISGIANSGRQSIDEWSAHALPIQPIFHDVGPELFLRQLQRRAGVGALADLDRIILAQRV